MGLPLVNSYRTILEAKKRYFVNKREFLVVNDWHADMVCTFTEVSAPRQITFVGHVGSDSNTKHILKL